MNKQRGRDTDRLTGRHRWSGRRGYLEEETDRWMDRHSNVCVCVFQGPLKTETVKHVAKYVQRDERLPVLLDRLVYMYRHF